MLQSGCVNVVIDGQWGSTGKGKLLGWLYNRYDVDIAVSDNMPNAGHTYVDNGDKSYVLKSLPIGSLFQGVSCVIGPHSVLNLDRLHKEIIFTGLHDLIIHPNVAVVLDADIKEEEEIVKRIASTGQGSFPATARKMRRHGYTIAGDVPELKTYIGDTAKWVQEALVRNHTVLAEGSQGFDLGINYGHRYPHVTSRDVLVGRMLDNAGVPVKRIGSIIASLRTLPIRVGDVGDATSGPRYTDHRELTWRDVSILAGRTIEERTTVTDRVRRVFSWSNDQVKKFCQYVAPNYAFLNFVNYLKHDAQTRIELVRILLEEFDCRLALLGTGPRLQDMVRYEDYVRDRTSLCGEDDVRSEPVQP